MILSWALIGIIVGLLLGITGAGGAIVAVPLFVFFADVGVRDATALSLIAVMAGAALNWLVQIRNTDSRLALLLFAFSIAGSILFKPVKAQSPEWVITTLFVGVALLSLTFIWKKSRTADREAPKAASSMKSLLLKTSAGGLSLGVLITMTGLGGGVVIIPYLKAVYGLTLQRAAATSLLTILLSSVFSLWLQLDAIGPKLSASPVLALIAGSIASAFGTRQILKTVSQAKLDYFRKALVTLVILLSAGSLLLRT